MHVHIHRKTGSRHSHRRLNGQTFSQPVAGTGRAAAALKHIWPRLGDDGLCSPQQAAAAAAADAGNSCPVIGRAVLPCVSHWRQESVGNRKKKGTWPD